jgi:hypothetical protein
MLNKDQVFAINDFVNDNSCCKLWQVSEKLIQMTSEVVNNDAQKEFLNKFILKNATQKITELENSIYSLFKELLTIKEIATVNESSESNL